MKQTRWFFCLTLAIGLLSALTVGASAAGLEYDFDGAAAPEYAPSTSYEDTYGGAYNYGGRNAVDDQIPELPYGTTSNTSIGAMEKARYPTGAASAAPSSSGWSGSSGGVIFGEGITTGATTPVWKPTLFTSAAGLVRADGSLGTLKIPSLGINMKVYEGESNASMAKGLGHYSSTSAWDGNVGLCGHNRGAKHVIGSIRNLQAGDTITYTTKLGTRTYAVVSVDIISSTDWTELGATSDNRITITTCLADHPEKRVCVQAVEVL